MKNYPIEIYSRKQKNLKNVIKMGKVLMIYLVEAFAVVREACEACTWYVSISVFSSWVVLLYMKEILRK